MLVHPNFDPIAFTIGPWNLGLFTLEWPVRWYGIMYLVAFAAFLVLGRRRAREAWRGFTAVQVEDLLFWGVFGVIVGGRLGYVLFYLPGYFLAHPLEVFMPWKGGMASHGGILGVACVMWWFAHSRGKSFLQVADFVVPLVPLGLAAGRLGNFINGELWGRPADPATWPWAMVFPQAPDAQPRHPSQLYQMGLEGLTLFALLWWYSRKPRPPGAVGSAFLFGYGVFRVLAEFAREPDGFLGPLALGLSMGQWLSMPMVVLGAGLWIWFTRRAASKAAPRPGVTSARGGGAAR
jgi:phosphatidylglycerol:prolipoprotein diacylglycerol transferase